MATLTRSSSPTRQSHRLIYRGETTDHETTGLTIPAGTDKLTDTDGDPVVQLKEIISEHGIVEPTLPQRTAYDTLDRFQLGEYQLTVAEYPSTAPTEYLLIWRSTQTDDAGAATVSNDVAIALSADLATRPDTRLLPDGGWAAHAVVPELQEADPTTLFTTDRLTTTLPDRVALVSEIWDYLASRATSEVPASGSELITTTTARDVAALLQAGLLPWPHSVFPTATGNGHHDPLPEHDLLASILDTLLEFAAHDLTVRNWIHEGAAQSVLGDPPEATGLVQTPADHIAWEWIAGINNQTQWMATPNLTGAPPGWTPRTVTISPADDVTVTP
ncbi:hypothetical protein RYH80_17945 [Halobaculum sp. MBLA0147]|uniref:hypothetical protein n=1 Tax=Halobaculum sp. MBLA0147 TaxID=3079934 RepID=UPI003523F4FF